jgi:Tfp pilus assembly protein PilF
MLHRFPELLGQAAEVRLAELVDSAQQDGDDEAAAVYQLHLQLIDHSRRIGVDKAVADLREAAVAVPEVSGEGSAAYRRYRATGAPTDLTAALALFERAAVLAGPTHPDRSGVLNNLGLALFDSYSLDQRRQAELDRAITVLEESVAATAPAAAERSAPLANLGVALLARRGARGFDNDLQRATEVLQQAAGLAVDDPDERARRLTNLGIALSERHLRDGEPQLLERAITAYEDALALTPAGSGQRGERLANLGTGVAERYTARGDPDDLDRAVDLMSRAVAASTEKTGPDVTDRTENLALLLRDRYVRDGDLVDLDRAVEHLETAVNRTGAASVARPPRLDQLATTLRLRALRRGDSSELNRAAQLHRQAAQLIDGNALERPAVLNNLGGTLRAWAAATGARDTLDEALHAYRAALSVAAAVERGAVLTNLGSAILDRYDMTGETRDLDDAIATLSASVEVTGPDSPELPARLNNLANGLRRRFERDGRPADAEQAVDGYRRGQLLGLAKASEAALRCGLNWGAWSIRRHRWADADEAYDQARQAADRLLRRQIVRRDMEAWLSAVGDMPAQAAYARCQTRRPLAAAVWLEWGRARVLSDMLDRARLGHLAADQPDLVNRYRQAATRLNAGQRHRVAPGQGAPPGSAAGGSR